VRGLVKICKILILSVINVIALLFGALILLIPKKSLRLRAATACMSVWAKYNCEILGVRISRTGLRKIPKGSFIAANHCSYLDILVLGSLIPCAFVSKKDVSSWPLIGWLAARAGTIFIDRASRMTIARTLREVKTYLSSGTSVVVFPEGTTNNGVDILEFKSSLFKAPVEQNSPILPVSIVYSQIDEKPVERDEAHGVAWYGNMSLLPHLWNVLEMKSIDVRVHFNPAILEITSIDAAQARKLAAVSAYNIVKEGCYSHF